MYVYTYVYVYVYVYVHVYVRVYVYVLAFSRISGIVSMVVDVCLFVYYASLHIYIFVHSLYI